jgi:hypothetical protein
MATYIDTSLNSLIGGEPIISCLIPGPDLKNLFAEYTIQFSTLILLMPLGVVERKKVYGNGPV